MTAAENELLDAALAAFDTPTLLAISAEMAPDPWTRLKQALRAVKRERAEAAVRLDAAVRHYDRV